MRILGVSNAWDAGAALVVAIGEALDGQ